MGWRNPRWNSLRGPDADILRSIFQSLENFIENPTFERGITVGSATGNDPDSFDYVPPTVDIEAGYVIPPPVRTVDLDSLEDIEDDVDGAGQRGVAIVTGLPELPDPELYPLGKVVYNTVDEKLWRSTGDTWTAAVDGADLMAATVTTNAIVAGAIDASRLAAIELEVGKYIRSNGFESGETGWAIDADGTAEFNSLYVRGAVEATEFTALGGPNLMPNPDIEDATPLWTASGPMTITRSASNPRTGTYSLKIEASGNGAWATAPNSFPVVEGKAYRVDAWCTHTVSERPRARVRWHDDTGTLISEDYVSFTLGIGLSTDLPLADGTLIAPTGAVLAVVSFGWTTKSFVGETSTYLDVVQFRRAPQIDGGVFRTALGGPRLEMGIEGDSKITSYVNGSQLTPGTVEWSSTVLAESELHISSGAITSHPAADITLESAGASATSRIVVKGRTLTFQAPAGESASQATFDHSLFAAGITSGADAAVWGNLTVDDDLTVGTGITVSSGGLVVSGATAFHDVVDFNDLTQFNVHAEALSSFSVVGTLSAFGNLNVSGILTLSSGQVTRGVVDSGGAGFRLLRVPNS